MSVIMSVPNLVDGIIDNATSIGASDIHFEPTESGLRVRIRIDGLLTQYTTIEVGLISQVLARIKVLASMDIAQQRLPQDGTFTVTNGDEVRDLRVSTFPSHYGEKIVIRILARDTASLPLGELGLTDDMLQELRSIIKRASGFFLVAGPTGSGKTTTLYSMLSVLNSETRNIVTLEDPIEYTLNGITQSQIHEEIGFTFARGIRSLLRQDPDVILVGEIRDKDTAQVAIQAALTGHMVLSTIHTHDTIGAIMRLLDMGIPAFLINATLSGVLSQRLVRLLCRECGGLTQDSTQEHFETKSGRQTQRCAHCNNRWFKGRIGVFEMLTMNDELREVLTATPSYSVLKNYLHQSGVRTLVDDADLKVARGLTSKEECFRVLY